MSRGAEVAAIRTRPDEIEARVTNDKGVSTPLIVLSPEHEDWNCDCSSVETACAHVAAAVILLRQAQQQGDAPIPHASPAARIAYRLSRIDGGLGIEMLLVRGEEREVVTRNLGSIQKKLGPGRLRLTPADKVMDRVLRERRVGAIIKAAMPRVLAALAKCDDVMLEGQRVTIDEPAPVVRLYLDQAPKKTYRLHAEADAELDEIFTNGAARRGDTIFAIKALNLSKNDLEVLHTGRVFDKSDVHALVTRILPELDSRVGVTVRAKKLPSVKAMKVRVVVETEFDGETLSVMPVLVYGDPPKARIEGDRLTSLGGVLPLRDLDAEAQVARDLRTAVGLLPGRARNAVGDEAIALAGELRAWGGRIGGDGLDGCFVAAPLTPQLEVEGRHFDLSFLTEYQGEERLASARSVVAAWERGDARVALTGGGWAPVPMEFLNSHGHLVADLLAARGEEAEAPPSLAHDLAALCEALDHPVPPDLDRLRNLADDFDSIPAAELPADLTADLRDYQREGIDWLAFLGAADLGAMLADDMGLGKTLQALCVLKAPALVVCPASVMHSWREEIERFRPGLSTHTYHGPRRKLSEQADVTLTTYAILRQDIDLLAARRWDVAVLDETQNIKNPQSQVAQAAYKLDARVRIALTGTPIENRLDDLWSQFHFLNPGLLAGRSRFQDRYAKPIAAGDGEVAADLRRRIRPFLLRRLKANVASELPPRTDVVLQCTLSESERAAYDAVRAATQAEIVAALATGGNVMQALEALLRLRQASCHTGLLPGREADTSSKIELLMETLEEVLAEGHRALVFSQWTSFLDRVEPHFEAAGVRFSRLDGSTRDRGRVVTDFQADDGPAVMLLSLKAGGTGLTLTRADHVFLLDPWWNPAVEDQAADRIHRIGQERPVLVHRLVAKDSVEERILELQKRKRALAEAAIERGTGGSALTRDDLMYLLGD